MLGVTGGELKKKEKQKNVKGKIREGNQAWTARRKDARR